MLRSHPSTNPSGLDALVRELDVLIRARYPLISVTSFEELRFRRLMGAVALHLRDGRHQPTEAQLLEARDADEWVAGADQDVQLAHEGVEARRIGRTL